ncbi:putative ankyrin repeat protein RF_0381 [Zingiber officinale]|uniref:Uncharacterized protein n=1 Tax=Zingiber officinale TaxID=94328 RepID=A0A8J5L967_ZINOF|nr:putative ankyrin repeat protein RF_0381 [Zingiber officinale]KAG6518851.1 hypothetical protein ZIOFF_022332 [Zingiber officinale]
MENPGATSNSKKKRGFRKDEGLPLPDLHTAARTGDRLTVVSICNTNPLAVNSRDRLSRTPLHLAAWSGQTEVVKFLCNNKADVGAAAMDDTAAIHFAAQKGHLETIQVLLSSGVSVKAANRKGFTALHYAVQGSHAELIKYLIRKGASLTAKTKGGQTPADLASTEEIRALLEDGKQSPAVQEKSTRTKLDADSMTEDCAEEKDRGSMPKELVLVDEGTCVNEKRNDKEVDDVGSLKTKKAKVSLDHLVAESDEQDGEE